MISFHSVSVVGLSSSQVWSLVINPNGLVAVRGNWPALCGSFAI
nr:MAG TPA: hypothetical protein [Bacteriophage sp.]